LRADPMIYLDVSLGTPYFNPQFFELHNNFVTLSFLQDCLKTSAQSQKTKKDPDDVFDEFPLKKVQVQHERTSDVQSKPCSRHGRNVNPTEFACDTVKPPSFRLSHRSNKTVHAINLPTVIRKLLLCFFNTEYTLRILVVKYEYVRTQYSST
jgi:hypothetical protein